jgi:hypothetical protein
MTPGGPLRGRFDDHGITLFSPGLSSSGPGAGNIYICR